LQVPHFGKAGPRVRGGDVITISLRSPWALVQLGLLKSRAVQPA